MSCHEQPSDPASPRASRRVGMVAALMKNLLPQRESSGMGSSTQRFQWNDYGIGGSDRRRTVISAATLCNFIRRTHLTNRGLRGQVPPFFSQNDPRPSRGMSRLKGSFVLLLLFVMPSPAQAAHESVVRAFVIAQSVPTSDEEPREVPFVTRLRARVVPPPDLVRSERSPPQSAVPVRIEGIDTEQPVLVTIVDDRGIPVTPRLSERLPYDATAPPRQR
jgi:hypothetical protein